MKIWQILVACILVGIASACIARVKGRSVWLWGLLGFAIFGIIVHTVVGILVFLFFA